MLKVFIAHRMRYLITYSKSFPNSAHPNQPLLNIVIPQRVVVRYKPVLIASYILVFARFTVHLS